MSDVQELERSITAAQAAGDTAQLERLQAQYRATAGVVRVTRGPVHLIERSVPTRAPEVSPAPEPTGAVPSGVRLCREAYGVIVNDWPHENGCENGGFLVGYEDGDEFVVESVFGAKGSNFAGERDRIVLDTRWFGVVEAKAQRYGQRILGDVHSHPRGEPRLSETDERGLRGGADHLKRHYLGVVVGRDPDRLSWGATDNLWARPELRAYIAIHGDRTVRPIPLVIEGRG